MREAASHICVPFAPLLVPLFYFLQMWVSEISVERRKQIDENVSRISDDSDATGRWENVYSRYHFTRGWIEDAEGK
jgi:hypothetical protein